MVHEDYDRVLLGTNPIDNCHNLPDDIEIHISEHDYFIPTKHGYELLEGLDELEKKYQLFKYNKGHVLTLYEYGQRNFL